MGQARAVCPVCGVELSLLSPSGISSDLYCRVCHWNVDAMRLKSRNAMVVSGLVLALATATVVSELISPRRTGFPSERYFFDFALVFLPLGTSLWRVGQGYRTLSGLKPEKSRAVTGGAAPEEFLRSLPPIEQRSTLFPELAGIPVPRQVVMGKAGRLWIAAALLPAFILVAAQFASGDISAFVAMAFLSALFFSVPVTIRLAREWPRRKLFRTGTESLGRIVSPRPCPLYYSFVDSSFRGRVVRSPDFPGSGGTNAPTLVFYDPEDADKNVSIDGSWWTLRLPGQRGD